MRIFDKVEDIDWDWVKKKEIVKYESRPEISSSKLLDYLC